MRRWRCARCKMPCLVALATAGAFVWFWYLDNPWSQMEEQDKWVAPPEEDANDGGRSFQTLTKVLLATEMLCLVAEQMGKGSQVHTLCKQTAHSKTGTTNITLVSLESSDLSFEESLASRSPDNRVYVVTSNASHTSDNLMSNVHPVVPSALQAALPSLSKSSWVREVESLLSSQAPVHVLKLGSTASLPVQPWMVRSLLENRYLSRVGQLLLVVGELRRRGSFPSRGLTGDLSLAEATEAATWRRWAKVASQLRDSGGFGVFHTQNDGNCSPVRCRYVTSWLRRPASSARISHASGQEAGENGTVDALRFLSKTTAYCRRRLSVPAPRPSEGDRGVTVVPESSPRASDWPVCLDNLPSSCLAYCIRIGGSAVFEETLEMLGCRVFVFDPSFKDTNFTRGSKGNVHGFAWGVRTATADKTVVPGIFGGATRDDWTYLTPLEITAKLGHRDATIDVLHIDAHGSEWAILDALVSSGVISRVRQIVATVHVWFGEEYFNLAARSARARQLEGLGFGVFFTEPMAVASGSRREKTEDCCRVVGWIRLRPASR